MYTPYSAYPYNFSGGLLQPTFDWQYIEDASDGLQPLSERDIEWLIAFLKSCKFMSGMEDANWSETESVAQMWRRHEG